MDQELSQDEDWRQRMPFLRDYNMGDTMLVKNMVFHIANKKYSLNLKLKQTPTTHYAHFLLNPDRIDDRPDRTYYQQLIEIHYRIDYIQDIIRDVTLWQLNSNTQQGNSLFWVHIVNEVVEERLLSTWRKLIRSLRAKQQAIICMQQRKRMMEFAVLINTKIRDVSMKNYGFQAKENHITFKILRYAFDFHPLNKKAFYKRDEGQDTLKRKLFDMEE
jgi:hypothetical protein